MREIVRELPENKITIKHPVADKRRVKRAGNRFQSLKQHLCVRCEGGQILLDKM